VSASRGTRDHVAGPSLTAQFIVIFTGCGIG
jgi:hypothetical protein